MIDRIGGSSLRRVQACPASKVLTKRAKSMGLIPAVESSTPAAILGQAAHALAEQCLTLGIDPVFYEGKDIIVDNERIKVDARMIEGVSLHIEACRQQKGSTRTVYESTEEFSTVPGLSLHYTVGGTCDYVALTDDGFLVVVDYKNGVHFVENKNNSQLLLYASGIYLRLRKKYDIVTIRTVITQPNCSHPDGVVRVQDFSAREVRQWIRSHLYNSVRRVELATELVKSDAHAQRLIETSEVLPDSLGPNPSGDVCEFCDLAGICYTYRQHHATMLKINWTEKPIVFQPVNKLTKNELETILSNKRYLTKWLDDITEQTKYLLRSGQTLQNYKLVQTKNNRKWNQRKIRRRDRKLKSILDATELYTTEFCSPANIENKIYVKLKKENSKFTKKDAKNVINEFTQNEKNGQTLVHISDKRVSCIIDAREDFAEEIEKIKTKKR